MVKLYAGPCILSGLAAHSPKFLYCIDEFNYRDIRVVYCCYHKVENYGQVLVMGMLKVNISDRQFG